MIPRIIHYCWFGRGEIPQPVIGYISSWRKHMPDWTFRLWNEDNFDITGIPYVKEAYDAGKFAFVSDYVRLYALSQFGGVYLDTDVEVFRSFSDILSYPAFIGYEGSKTLPLGTSVIGSEPGGEWVSNQLRRYEGRHFLDESGRMDLTTNVRFITEDMKSKGLICDGKEKDLEGIHIFPVEYFSPRRTTGEYIITDNTYCDHKGLASWGEGRRIPFIFRIIGPDTKIKLIKLKRYLIG